MASFVFLLATVCVLLAFSVATAKIVEHTFHVKNLTVQPLCKRQVITAVNGSLPGPTIRAKEGDTLVVHLLNESPYNMTIHWHGIFQLLSAWADGAGQTTQCSVCPGHSYTYRFNITGQEGTLWWHAHVKWHRATVYGALVIRPRDGRTYPFPKPYREVLILLGEWWDANVVDVENEGLASGGAPNNSDAYTINGRPGDLYPCSSNKTFKLEVIQGKTYLLRIINTAHNHQLFFKIANHKMKVVAVDATYTDPYVTDVVVIAPGQTTDVLLTADQSPSLYYMAAHPYVTTVAAAVFDNTTATGILSYKGGTSSKPIMPVLPAFNDTDTTYKFYTNLTGLVSGPFWLPPPLEVDHKMFVTSGLGSEPCGSNASCAGPNGLRFAASMNNESFVFPTKLSMLEAFFNNNADSIYTTDFPSQPPFVFDYTNASNSYNPNLLITQKSTKVTKLKFNSTVEIVLQNTALISTENHPIHLHGFNFYVLALGFGNYDSVNDSKKFNLVNPQERNTIAVPVGGWAVIRFRANNPGVWLMHCHLDVHMSWGLSTAFVVENGPTPSSTLPPPPADLPKC